MSIHVCSSVTLLFRNLFFFFLQNFLCHVLTDILNLVKYGTYMLCWLCTLQISLLGLELVLSYS